MGATNVPNVKQLISIGETTPTAHFVAGEWYDGAGDDRFDVLDPSTGETLGALPVASDADVDRAARAAADAFPTWRGYSPGKREHVLREMADRLEADAEGFARLESLDVGKPLESGARPDELGLNPRPLTPVHSRAILEAAWEARPPLDLRV